LQVPDYADTLRALGRFLDDAGASDIQIKDEGDWWAVSWDRAGTRRLQFYQLDALRTVARLHRGQEGGIPRFTTAQMLRGLGNLLDDMNATTFSIVAGEPWDQTLSIDQIRSSLEERLQER
jgi:hypothetical protein